MKDVVSSRTERSLSLQMQMFWSCWGGQGPKRNRDASEARQTPNGLYLTRSNTPSSPPHCHQEADAVSTPRAASMAQAPAIDPQIAITRELIRRAYEEPRRNQRNTPFMSYHYGNRISNLESLAQMAQMYYGEGGPFHPRQLALRAAEPDTRRRDLLFKYCLVASYRRMVQSHFGPRGPHPGGRNTLTSAVPGSAPGGQTVGPA